MSKKVVFVSGNKGKIKEVISILTPEINVIANCDIELPEIQGTIEEISKEKCKFAVDKIQGPCIVEDTGLYFNALDGQPGPYIKYYLSSDPQQNKEKRLILTKMLKGFEDRSAFALCAVSFTVGPNKPIYTFVGKADGNITEVPQEAGTRIFGWDPVFSPKEYPGKSYAEITDEQKNNISSRKRALDQLKEFILKNPNY